MFGLGKKKPDEHHEKIDEQVINEKVSHDPIYRAIYTRWIEADKLIKELDTKLAEKDNIIKTLESQVATRKFYQRFVVTGIEIEAAKNIVIEKKQIARKEITPMLCEKLKIGNTKAKAVIDECINKRVFKANRKFLFASEE